MHTIQWYKQRWNTNTKGSPPGQNCTTLCGLCWLEWCKAGLQWIEKIKNLLKTYLDDKYEHGWKLSERRGQVIKSPSMTHWPYCRLSVTPWNRVLYILVYLVHIFWHPLISTVMPFHHIYISFRSESYHITSLAIISPPKGLGITLLLLLMNIPSHSIINMNKDNWL